VQYTYSFNQSIHQIKKANSKVFLFNQTLSFDDNKEAYGRRYNYEQMKTVQTDTGMSNLTFMA